MARSQTHPAYIHDQLSYRSVALGARTTNSAVVDRFELYIGGRELANAFPAQ
jgi:lysyl-tRNA synthetase class II